MMNAEFYLLKIAVMNMSNAEAVFLPGIHEHALYWADAESKGYKVCNQCNNKVGEKTGGYLALECGTCKPNNWGWGGFVVCTDCYRKQAAKATELGADSSQASLLRGDRGLRPAHEYSALQYITRMARLLRPVWGVTV